MANKNLFKSAALATQAGSVTANHAGGPAYALGAKEALAKYAAAGMLGDTYYVSAELQLQEVLRLSAACSPEFVAKCAVYSRQHGYLRDMPALLLASLTTRGPEGATAARAAWPHVVDNAKMLKNFCQVIRSGVVGRKNFGSVYRRLAAGWIVDRAQHASNAMLNDTVGNDPSLADIIKMVRPKPQDDAMRALFGYLIGKKNPHRIPMLPDRIFEYELFKMRRAAGNPVALDVPRVDFRLLDSLSLTDAEWRTVAERAPWQMTRMNLNTFKRHKVLDDPAMVKLIADRLRDRESIRGSKCFPYQLLAAYHAVARADTDDARMPMEIVNALHDAMEIATENTPHFPGSVVVCPDVSGSMRSPISGSRPGQPPSKINCVDVAALVAAVMLRNSDDCFVLPFDTSIHIDTSYTDQVSVMGLATDIARYGGGGTDCRLPLAFMLERMRPERLAELSAVVYVSDYESWADRHEGQYMFSRGDRVGMSSLWTQLKAKAPKAKLICIDLTPNTAVQVTTSRDRLNIGGFSDSVFSAIAGFMACDSDSYWVDCIERLAL